MEKFLINGGNRLEGEVNISGAKNSVVAILPATLLARDVCRIENIPDISDVHVMLEMLSAMGATVKYINRNTYEIDTTHINMHTVPYDLTRHLRASYYLLGALLGRSSRARVAMPGGCNFGGVRPIDQHLKGFELLGAEIVMEENAIVHAYKDGRLSGNSVYMDVVSVGATINIMLAAVTARGLTVIENAAKEPHIVDLANFLNSMGADVRGAGTDVIKIRGVDHMHGCEYSVIPDQIEAGTYMAAVVACGGNVLIKNIVPKHLDSITAKLEEIGVLVEEMDDSIRVIADKKLKKCNIKTLPHPGFPTDMQPQFTAALCLAEGTSIITEGVWDNRFKYVNQLNRMGANIEVSGKMAVVQGVNYLQGCNVQADDLRAGAAMIIAGLAARGTTEIENILYIERGYENVVEKFAALGGDIHRITVQDDPDQKVRSAG